MQLPALRRLGVEARRFGPGPALQLQAIRVLRRWMRLERIHIYALAVGAAATLPPRSGTTRLATREELLALASDPEWDLAGYDAGTIDELLDRGHRCVLNLDRTEVVGYSFLDPERLHIPRLGAEIALAAGEVHIYKGFTHRRARGHGFANDRYRFWLDHLAATGRQRLLTYFSFDNKATLRRVEKLDMRLAGTLTRIDSPAGSWLRFAGDLRERRLTVG